MGYNNQANHLGSWWNSWDDFTGDISNIFGGGGSGAPPGTLPPGARPPGTTGPIVYTPAPSVDDQGTVSAWASAVRASGAVPTRMPSAQTDPVGDTGHVGELAFRYDGPGTVYPNVSAPFAYYLAPDAVRAADARLLGKIGTDLNNTTLNFLKSLGLAPGTDGNAPNPVFDIGTLKTVLLWGGVGVAALLVLPVLLRSER